MGEFKSLFLFLGASLNASVDQYAMVLKQIWKQTSGTKMHPNEIRAAFRVCTLTIILSCLVWDSAVNKGQ